MSGKGDKRRPGTGYADNWDRIFGKKEERKPSGGQIWMLKSAMETPYMEHAAAARALADAQEPKLMTLSEARELGYSTWHNNCGPSASGAVLRVGKWDDALNCLQFIDVRPDADVAPFIRPTRVTGNFRCKVNGIDTGAGLPWFEFLPQPGFNYVLEAIEQPAKKCQHCKYWRPIVGDSERICIHRDVLNMCADGSGGLKATADFGCLRWEVKE